MRMLESSRMQNAEVRIRSLARCVIQSAAKNPGSFVLGPSGTPTATGTPNEWPFQYQGREKQFTDPGPYYYTGSGQFYSPQFVRSLSEAGQTSAAAQAAGRGSWRAAAAEAFRHRG